MRKTTENTVTTSIFLGSVLAIMLPMAFFVMAAGSDNFQATASVTDQPPTITVSSEQTWGGNAGTTVTRSLYFNATDPNGESDLNVSTAAAAINASGTSIVASSCGLDANIDVNTNQYECNFTLAYYHNEGTWSINVNISDNSEQQASNTSQTGSVDALDGAAAVSATLAFASGNPGATVAAPVQQLNNTGNQDYTSINLTGYTLAVGSNFIEVGNATVNVTDGSGNGQTLVNATEVLITGAAVNHGEDSKEDLYFYLNIPSGQPTGSYTSQQNWILEANP